MNTIHEALTTIAHDGARAFETTALAADHRGVTRTVRRHRTIRAGVTSVAGIALVGVGATVATQWRDGAGPAPAGPTHTDPQPEASAVPEATSTTPEPSASAAPLDEVQVEGPITITEGMRADQIAAEFARLFGVSVGEANAAMVAALPAEAEGNPEGWFAVGIWMPEEFSVLDGVGTYDPTDMEPLAEAAVARTIEILERQGVTPDTWQQTLVIASIVEEEATTYDDRRGVTRVIKNRLREDMPLQLDSTAYYYADVNGLDPTDDALGADNPYNTYVYQGLPPGPIGTPSADAIAATMEPLPGGALFFVRGSSGGALFAETYEEHLANIEELNAPTGTTVQPRFVDVEGRWCQPEPTHEGEACMTIDLPDVRFDGGIAPSSVVPFADDPEATVRADSVTDEDYTVEPDFGQCWSFSFNRPSYAEASLFIYCPAGEDAGPAWSSQPEQHLDVERVYITNGPDPVAYLRVDSDAAGTGN